MPSDAPRPQLTLESWRPYKKNTLCGFAAVRLPVGGATLVIKELTVHRKGDKMWVGFPAKPALDSAGQPQKNADGKPIYVSFLQWTEREYGDRFSAKVIELINQFHPGALS